VDVCSCDFAVVSGVVDQACSVILICFRVNLYVKLFVLRSG